MDQGIDVDEESDPSFSEGSDDDDDDDDDSDDNFDDDAKNNNEKSTKDSNNKASAPSLFETASTPASKPKKQAVKESTERSGET